MKESGSSMLREWKPVARRGTERRSCPLDLRAAMFERDRGRPSLVVSGLGMDRIGAVQDEGSKVGQSLLAEIAWSI